LYVLDEVKKHTLFFLFESENLTFNNIFLVKIKAP
jgi:hypothetical protein